MPLVDTIFLLAFTALGFVFPAVLAWRRRKIRRLEAQATMEAQPGAELVHLRSIHPVIDPNLCIGSLSCVQACPVGDILGLVGDRAQLVEPSRCIGHGRCAVDCPVDAIKLVYGTLTRGTELPNTDEFFESNRPGVYLIGEIVGMGLIRNCFAQGFEAAQNLSQHSYSANTDQVDVLIVGAGPAGLACAMGCRSQGLSFRILEQGTMGGTVAHFPRNKIVMVDHFNIPGFGKLGGGELSKEQLLDTFQELVNSFQIAIDEGVKVEGVTGHDGDFAVQSSRGTFHAAKVVLAIGRRGDPRKLGVEGENLPKVMYELREPELFNDASVLVVGGGDSAIEAACQLARESTAKISLSYRKNFFLSCRPQNRQEILAHIDSGRINSLMETTVYRIDSNAVGLHCPQKSADGHNAPAMNSDRIELEVANDYVLVCIGGELPGKLLSEVGLSVDMLHGEQKPRARQAQASRQVPIRDLQERRHKRLVYSLVTLGISIIAALIYVGQEYYWIAPSLRPSHPMHAFLKPAGIWGHSIGIGATFFMMLNFLYPLRKRWKRMKGTAPIQTWMTLHMFVGLMSPVVIGFHAAFLHANILATATWIALSIVVVTGLFGRYLYGLVPSTEGEVLTLSEVEALLLRHENRTLRHLKHASSQSAVTQLTQAAAHGGVGSSLLIVILGFPWRLFRRRLQLHRARALFKDAAQFEDFRRSIGELERIKTQVRSYKGLKSFFGAWRIFHASLAIFMVLLVSLHTGVMLFLGYGFD